MSSRLLLLRTPTCLLACAHKHESQLTRRNDVPGAPLPVGQAGRDREAPRLAHAHAGHAQFPAADHRALAEREPEWLVAVDAATDQRLSAALGETEEAFRSGRHGRGKRKA